MHYIAKLIFRISAGERHAFDEQLRMIAAESKKDAGLFASAVGKQEEESVTSYSGERIRWEFIGVCGVWELQEKGNGALVYSFTNESGEEEEDYINFVKLRHNEITGAADKLKPFPSEPVTPGHNAG